MPKLPGMLLAALMAITALQNGLYRDQADGYGGKVIVTVTIRDGKLTKLTTENTGGEKSEYYLKAEEALTKEILEKQSIEGVDAVAGATGTSESILKAMEGVFEQARYNGTPEENIAPAPTDKPGSVTNSVKEPTLTAWPHPTV